MHFADRLSDAITKKGNAVCIGIDPAIAHLPSSLDRDDPIQAIGDFTKAIIDAVWDIVPAVKFQSAYFEQYAGAGVMLMEEMMRYARSKELIVIADVKRGDIGTTAEAYAAAYLSSGSRGFDIDAVTINPYMGSDTVLPFVTDAKKFHKGVFILVKTSNPSSADFQDRMISTNALFEVVADAVARWGRNVIGTSGFSAVGAVVGATHSKELAMLRTHMPQQFFLVPGYGAQGASASDIVGAFDKKGHGALIVAARSVIFAYQKASRPIDEFAQSARDATIAMVHDIRSVLTR